MKNILITFAVMLLPSLSAAAKPTDIPKSCERSKARPANLYGSVLLEPEPVKENVPRELPSDDEILAPTTAKLSLRDGAHKSTRASEGSC